MSFGFGPRNFERGKKVAYESGAELQANPGENRQEYLNGAAFYFREGVEKVRDLTPEEKNALIMEFNKGIEAEKICQQNN